MSAKQIALAPPNWTTDLWVSRPAAALLQAMSREAALQIRGPPGNRDRSGRSVSSLIYSARCVQSATSQEDLGRMGRNLSFQPVSLGPSEWSRCLSLSCTSCRSAIPSGVPLHWAAGEEGGGRPGDSRNSIPGRFSSTDMDGEFTRVDGWIN